VRPATPADQGVIVDIIRAARINPMDLKWPNFVVAVDQATGQIVGTGQVKSHGDGTRELASIATVPAYQKQGIAGQVINTLLDMHPGVLYLTCMSYLGPFYERFGFREVPQAELTPYFRRLSRVARAFLFVNRRDERLLVMKRDGGEA
jgi:N-acetylglutamate synthase-like GNAT family acetyltransferase